MKANFERAGDILSVGIPGGLLAYLFFNNRAECYKLGVACLIVFVITHLIKTMTFAPRPNAKEGEWVKWDWSFKSGDSFPSGHTSSAMIGALYGLHVLNPYLGLAVYALAFLVALSRVHAKAHFYRDVFWGTFISQVVSLIVYFNLYGIVGWI